MFLLLCLCLLFTCTEQDKHQTKLEHMLIRLLLKNLQAVLDRACLLACTFYKASE